MGYTPAATWKRFVYEARTNLAASEAEVLSSEEGQGGTRESSVISIEDGSEDDQVDATMASVLEVSDEEDIESENGGMLVDWSLMCPYCDETLPSEPSDRLKHSCVLLDQKSTLDRNNPGVLANPYHRSIHPITTTLEYCTRHRFELNSANLVRNSAWVSALPVCFEDLEHQVISLVNILEDVSNYPLDNEFYQDLQRSIAASGESKAFGAVGQYSSINRTSAG